MTKDPRPWIDDPHAPDALREDLRTARDVAPQPYDEKAGLERLRTATAPPAGTASTTSLGSASLAAKLVGWGTLAAVAIGAGLGLWMTLSGGEPTVPDASGGAGSAPGETESPRPSPADPEPADRGVEPIAPPGGNGSATDDVGTDPGAAEEGSPPAVVRPAPEPAAAVRRGGGRPRGAREAPEGTPRTREAPAPSSAEQAVDPMHREIAQLARARRLLSSDPAAALALVEQGQREFGQGIFTEERSALAIFALDRIGREAEARARGERFLESHPDGPFSAQIRRMVRRMDLDSAAPP